MGLMQVTPAAARHAATNIGALREVSMPGPAQVFFFQPLLRGVAKWTRSICRP